MSNSSVTRSVITCKGKFMLQSINYKSVLHAQISRAELDVTKVVSSTEWILDDGIMFIVCIRMRDLQLWCAGDRSDGAWRR